jgi:hypothetical protein
MKYLLVICIREYVSGPALQGNNGIRCNGVSNTTVSILAPKTESYQAIRTFHNDVRIVIVYQNCKALMCDPHINPDI